MYDPYLWLTIIAATGMLSIGAVSLIRDSKTPVNRTFMLLVLSVIGWIVSNYLSNSGDISYRAALWANYAVFGFSYTVGVLVVQFVTLYTQDKKFTKLYSRIRWLLWALIPVMASPLVIKDIYRQGAVYNIVFGPLLAVYAGLLIGSLALGLYILRHSLKRAGHYEKRRIGTMYTVILICAPLIILVQFVLPAATGWFGLTNLGVLPIFGVVFGLYYGIARQRLFNVTPSFMRSIVYAVTVGLLTLGYLVVSSAVSTLVLVQQSRVTHAFVNGGLILAVLVGYRPLLDLFRRITDKVFLQNSYDPKELYDKLNAQLVSTIDLQKLLVQGGDFLTEAMKLEYMTFLLWSGKPVYREFGSKDKSISHELQAYLYTHNIFENSQLIITEDVLKSDQKLLTLLEKNNVAAMVRMEFKHGVRIGKWNYVIVGPKRNGYPYSGEDRSTLETVVNELALAVQNALQYEEIKAFNATLQEKVEYATRKLKASNERLKKLDETKDDFISMASHQLRTPLTSVKGYVSMVLDGDAGTVNDGQRKMLNQAFVSAQRMVFLISDLLNLSRLNTGRFVIEAKPIDLRVVISEELKQLEETAAARGIKLVYKRPETFPTLMFDDMKIRQVVMNFVDNAIYYTPANGTVTIELHEDDKYVEFRVKDTGIGVPRHEQPHLFTKFYRAQNARQARPDGTGLGLFMAKKVIIAQGGVVIFESREGKGSIFGFHFSKEKLAVFGAGSPGPTGVEASAAGS